MRRKFLRHRIAQGKDVDDKLVKEFSARRLLIHRPDGLARCHDLIEAEPLGKQVFAGVSNESALKRWLGADKKQLALRRERVFARCILGKKIEAHQDVHD